MFSILRFDLFTFGLAIAAILILGSIIFFSNKKSATSVLFLLLTLVSSLWGVLNYLSYQIYDSFWSPLIVRLVMFFAIYQAFTFFLLTKAFPGKKISLPKWFKYFIFPLVILVSVLTLTPLVFSGVEIVSGSLPQPKPGPLIPLFALVAVSLVVGGIVQLIKRMKVAVGKEKMQFRLMMAGVILMFSLIIIFNFVLVAFFENSSFIPFSGLFILPFAAFTFYAIARHEMLNIRIVGTEVLTFVLIVSSFFEVILSKSIDETIFRSGLFVVLIIFGVLFIRSAVREVKQREKLQELTEKLKALDEQKDTFISMAAHELRAPMTAIKGYVSMVMEGDTGDIPEKARGFLADASNITDRLVRLVNNMLNVSRIEEGRMVFQVETENLSQVVRAVFNQFVAEAERKNLIYKLEIPTEVKDMVEVDPDRIQEVIGNFLSNAIKYTDQGSVKVKLFQPKEGIIRCEVVDTGPGISKEEQSKLFQKFYRVESNVGKTTGSGLGLYIARLLVEKFGGKIGIISEVGKGSTFWFELPVVKKA